LPGKNPVADSSPRIWTIPPGVSFVDALADGLLQRTGRDRLALHDMLVLLPTRRACRALTEAFLRQTDGEALLLPRLMPLGEAGEDDGIGADEGLPDADPVSLPPAVPEMQRLLLLARLIARERLKTGDGDPVSPGNAVRLARDLAGLLDQIHTEGLSFEGLAGLVPADYADHWQITLDFLKVLTAGWPDVLEVLGCIDPAARRDALIRGRIRDWTKSTPGFPVFAAGSTGSIPATAELLVAIAGFSSGGVILPGLDTGLSADASAALEPTHPQFGMAALLRRMDLSPDQVPVWSNSLVPSAPPARARLVAEALAPATGTAPVRFDDAAEALTNIRLIECPGQVEEAGVIALALRRALETPGKTAALVTPDRNLARRVAAELNRWDIEIDDSAGRPLAQTPPGLFLRLAAAAFAEDCAPLPLLSLLKHPLAAAGLPSGRFRANVRQLEIAVLRGPRPAPGLAGIAAALSNTPELEGWFMALKDRARHFAEIMRGQDPVPARDILAAHLDFAEALAATDAETGAARLWAGDAGEAAADFVASLSEAEGFDPIVPADYPDFLEALLAGQTVRPRFGTHPRLNIWGLLEARLQNADLVCLGGLNEGSWPGDPGADPWMSRPMREEFGLPPHERRIGLSAHDFAQAFCAREVLLTRAHKVDGGPTVPSRWLLMLETRLRAGYEEKEVAPDLKGGDVGDDLAGWQLGVDRPEKIEPGAPPAPRPPVAARPRRLSVTTIETWRRDPYSIFARYILGLRPLDEIDADPGAAERGTIIHGALDTFLRRTADGLPENPLAMLIEIGEEAFGRDLARPGVKAFWWPRFLRIAEWFVAEERACRADRRRVWTEIEGRLEFAAPGGSFTLTAHADRVDLLTDGTLAIIDYKTGAKPTNEAIRFGFAPQLPLEAAIAAAGGFEGVPPTPVSALEFWKLSGGREAGKREPVREDIPELAQMARDGLARLVARFDDPETPYFARPDGRWASRFPEYDHLARVAEWADSDGDGE